MMAGGRQTLQCRLPRPLGHWTKLNQRSQNLVMELGVLTEDLTARSAVAAADVAAAVTAELPSLGAMVLLRTLSIVLLNPVHEASAPPSVLGPK